jgi:hypothetical protein
VRCISCAVTHMKPEHATSHIRQSAYDGLGCSNNNCARILKQIMLCLRKGKGWAKRHAMCWSPTTPQCHLDNVSPEGSFIQSPKRHRDLQHHLAAPEGTCGLFSSM